MNKFFANDKLILSECVNRLLNCTRERKLYLYGDIKDELSNLYPDVETKELNFFERVDRHMVCFIKIKKDKWEKISTWINKNQHIVDVVLYASSDEDKEFVINQSLYRWYDISHYSDLIGSVALIGPSFTYKGNIQNKKNFKVLAIIHTYNEADVIVKTMKHIINQGIDVWVADNWSEDGTYELICELQKSYPSKITVERFPKEGKSNYYEWYGQLQHTEELSKRLNYDWFMHYDADEIRVTPWENVSLHDFIYQVNQYGYNLIDTTVIDFKLTDEKEKIFGENTYFDFGHRPAHFEQLKTWKKCKEVDLKKSGGHIAVVADPHICPIKIINKHYSFRSIEQARKKVFVDRKPRFEKEKRKYGWHGHYDSINSVKDLLNPKQDLLLWKQGVQSTYFLPLSLGVGIYKECNKQEMDTISCFGKKVILYGAGKIGKQVYLQYARENWILAWVDKNYKNIPWIYCKEIKHPDSIQEYEYDIILVAVEEKNLFDQIKKELIEKGIKADVVFHVMNQ